MLQLAEYVPQPEIEVLYLAVEDGEPLSYDLITQGIEFLEKQRKQNSRTLVSCGAGISRSATFCVAALHEAEGLSPLDAYRDLHRVYSLAMPNMYLWRSLLAYYGQDVSLRDAAEQILEIYDQLDRP